MKALENIATILLTIVFLVFVPVGMTVRDCGDNLELCAEESVNDILADVRADGLFTEERFSVLSSFLYSCGYQGYFEIMEYYYEDGIDGNRHQYAVASEEIFDEIMENGYYQFREGSYVYLLVPAHAPDNLLTRILFSRKVIETSIQIS